MANARSSCSVMDSLGKWSWTADFRLPQSVRHARFATRQPVACGPRTTSYREGIGCGRSGGTGDRHRRRYGGQSHQLRRGFDPTGTSSEHISQFDAGTSVQLASPFSLIFAPAEIPQSKCGIASVHRKTESLRPSHAPTHRGIGDRCIPRSKSCYC